MGLSTERKLWKAGVESWGQALERPELLPPARRVTVLRAMHDTGNALRLWLIGQGVVMLSMGLMMWAAYAWLGLPSAAALALIAALADFVPFIGPILGALPALVIASTIDMQTLPWTLGAVVVAHYDTLDERLPWRCTLELQP